MLRSQILRDAPSIAAFVVFGFVKSHGERLTPLLETRCTCDQYLSIPLRGKQRNVGICRLEPLCPTFPGTATQFRRYRHYNATANDSWIDQYGPS